MLLLFSQTNRQIDTQTNRHTGEHKHLSRRTASPIIRYFDPVGVGCCPVRQIERIVEPETACRLHTLACGTLYIIMCSSYVHSIRECLLQ